MTNEVLQKTASDEQNVSSSNGLEPSLRFTGFYENWHEKYIKDVADVIGGGTPDTTKLEYWNGNIQWFTPTEIGHNKYVNKSKRTITEKGLKNSSAKLLPPKTILLTSRATIGECSIIEKECATNQGFQSLVPNSLINNEFCYYLINTKKKELLRKASGSTFLEISNSEIKQIKCKFPSLLEQQKIATFLSLMDTRIEKQRQLVESLKKYKRGLFLKLYNDSEKKGYKICDLGKYCATGALSKDDIDVSGKYPCILYGELFTKYGEVIKQVASRTNIIPTYLSGTNEILFPSSTTADAQSLIFPSSLKIKNIFLGGDLFTIKLKNEFDSDFISYLVNFKYKNTLARYAQGITIIHLHYTDIKEQVIDIPNVNTQFNISSVMRKIETIIEMNSNELNSLLLMKKGFLQKMFI